MTAFLTLVRLQNLGQQHITLWVTSGCFSAPVKRSTLAIRATETLHVLHEGQRQVEIKAVRTHSPEPVFVTQSVTLPTECFLLPVETDITRPPVCLLYGSACGFGWRPVCLPHCHPLWMLLGEGCHWCLLHSPACPLTCTALPHFLPVPPSIFLALICHTHFAHCIPCTPRQPD